MISKISIVRKVPFAEGRYIGANVGADARLHPAPVPSFTWKKPATPRSFPNPYICAPVSATGTAFPPFPLLMSSFESLGIRAEILRALTDLGFENPTPVQEKTIPFLLTGEGDMVALAQTGTGKTAAFGIPLLERIDKDLKTVQALVLAPTRELCVQITKDIEHFAAHLPGIKCVPVYGGANIRDQIRGIQRGANVVVATPGRLIDLLERGAVDLGHVKVAVLDEADEMLNMGFQEDLTTILDRTPKEKRTWLFSATMSNEVRRIAKNYMREAEEVSLGGAGKANESIQHRYTVVMARDRYLALRRFVDADPDMFAIVFCRTKQDTQELAENLGRDGYNADAIHGDLSQQQRDRVMAVSYTHLTLPTSDLV